MTSFTYVYSGINCDLTFIFPVINVPTYIIGSNTPLTSGDTVSVSDINSPSKKQCVTITSDGVVTGQTPTYSYNESYTDCLSCFSSNTILALVTPCNNDSEFSDLPLVVSNLYQIGDIITIPTFFYNEGGQDVGVIFNGCFKITDIQPYEDIPEPQNQIIEYAPQQSCEICKSCLGEYYQYYDCNTESGGYLYSNQTLQQGDVINLSGSCVYIDSVLNPITFENIELINNIITGSTKVTSTFVYEDCDSCTDKVDQLRTWEELSTNNLILSNLGLNNYSISSPERDCDSTGWAYIKQQMVCSGTISITYQTGDSPTTSFPFYYVGSQEPTGNNINFYQNQIPPSIFFSTISFNVNAGDWVAIGVYAPDDSCNVDFTFEVFGPLGCVGEFPFLSCYGEGGTIQLSESEYTSLMSVTELPYSPISVDDLNKMGNPTFGNKDEGYIEVSFPSGFSANFLCTNYTSAFLNTNAFLTFGGSQTDYGFELPLDIPDVIGFPGLFISVLDMDMDLSVEGTDWYSGVTNGGNNFVIGYDGVYYNTDDHVKLFYVFHLNNPSIYDVVIEENTQFNDDNPTGGINDGSNPLWIGSFDCSSNKKYRVTDNCPTFKANFGTTPSICGNVIDTEFVNTFGFMYSEVNPTYENCQDCVTRYGVTAKDCSTNQIYYLLMSLSDINDVFAQGPIFANGGSECLEILDYCPIPDGDLYIPYLFYQTCEQCKEPFSANTESKVCVVCCPCTSGGTINSVSPPHPVWTNQRGKAVVQLNMVVLGGENGLNS